MRNSQLPPPSALTDACRRLDPPRLTALLTIHLGARWQAAATHARGPCPAGVGGCVADHRAASAYPSAAGWAPWIKCHHGSCGFSATLLEMLEDRLGSGRAAAQAIIDAASGQGLTISASTPATGRREGSQKKVESAPDTSDQDAIDALERYFDRTILATYERKELVAMPAVVIEARRCDSRKKKRMLVLDLGLWTENGRARAPLFVPFSMATWHENVVADLAPEWADTRPECVPLEAFVGRLVLVGARLETGNYGPKTKIDSIRSLDPGAMPEEWVTEARQLIEAARAGVSVVRR